MHHYLFYEVTTGEEFIVGAENYDIACGIAEAVWDDYSDEAQVKYLYEMSELEAEASGLDEY